MVNNPSTFLIFYNLPMSVVSSSPTFEIFIILLIEVVSGYPTFTIFYNLLTGSMTQPYFNYLNFLKILLIAY